MHNAKAVANRGQQATGHRRVGKTALSNCCEGLALLGLLSMPCCSTCSNSTAYLHHWRFYVVHVLYGTVRTPGRSAKKIAHRLSTRTENPRVIPQFTGYGLVWSPVPVGEYIRTYSTYTSRSNEYTHRVGTVRIYVPYGTTCTVRFHRYTVSTAHVSTVRTVKKVPRRVFLCGQEQQTVK